MRICQWKYILLGMGVMGTVLLAGCGQNETGAETSCEADADCPTGKYCFDAQGVCTQECDPLKGVAACGPGEVCTKRGRCVPGECQSAEDCDEPPAAACTDDQLMTPEDRGDCVEKNGERTCEYDTMPVTCDYGCSDGECNQSPCASKACNQPPAAECSDDGEDRITYGSPGTCDDATGDCSYEPMRTPCPFGCDGGKCNDGPCDTVTCDDPPAAECNGDVKVEYASNGNCVRENDQATCEYDTTLTHCRYTGASCSSGSCTGAVSQSGEIVVTELMADPEATEDYNGEWIEVLNTTSSTIDLQDWELTSEGDPGHTIQESVTISAGSRAVLALSPDPAGNGDVSPDYVYEDFQLSNGSDMIRLVDPSGSISDHVFYEAGAIMDGLARMLNPSVTPTASSNDDFENWCPALSSSDKFGTDGRDRGTPGEPNASCSQTPCMDWTCQKPEGFCQDGTATRPTKDNATCNESRFNNPTCDYDVQSFACMSTELCAEGYCRSIPSGKPQKGELVITELMGDPTNVNDTDGEWIEIYNPTNRDIPLFSLKIEDSETGRAHDSYTIKLPNKKIPAGGYVVVARNTDPSQNGGISNAIGYSGSHLKNTPGSNMSIELVRQDGTEVDAARYLTPTTGASQQLDDSVYSGASMPAQKNDGSANWCDGSMSYGAGGDGTPGAQNRSCP